LPEKEIYLNNFEPIINDEKSESKIVNDESTTSKIMTENESNESNIDFSSITVDKLVNVTFEKTIEMSRLSTNDTWVKDMSKITLSWENLANYQIFYSLYVIVILVKNILKDEFGFTKSGSLFSTTAASTSNSSEPQKPEEENLEEKENIDSKGDLYWNKSPIMCQIKFEIYFTIKKKQRQFWIKKI
jgi:hypothetical protein